MTRPDPIGFVINGQPVAWDRAGVGGKRFFKRAKVRAYQDIVRLKAREAMRGAVPVEGAVEVWVQVWLAVPASWSKKKRAEALEHRRRPTAKPDSDNYAKNILDACNGVVWRDDSQVVDLHVSKHFCAEAALVVRVQPLEEQQEAEPKELALARSVA